jgi:hypothetical protein
MKVMVVGLSEVLGPEQRVDEIDQQSERHDRSERIVETHDPFSSEPVTGVAVADRQHEKAEPDGQHDDVHHLGAPKRKFARINETFGDTRASLTCINGCAGLAASAHDVPLAPI